MLQSQQTRHYVGKDRTNADVFVGQNAINDLLTITTGAPLTFTQTQAVDNKILSNTSKPAGVAYIDGSDDKSRIGGVILGNSTALPSPTLVFNGDQVKPRNLVEILDTDHNEVKDGDKIVYALLYSNANDGGAIPTQIYAQFVTYDAANNTFEKYVLPKGTYVYEPKIANTLGALASTGGDLNSIFTGRGDYNEKGGTSSDYASLKIADNITLPTSVITVNKTATDTIFKDSAGVTINTIGTKLAEPLKQSVAGATGLAYLDGYTVKINGVAVPRANVSFVDANNMAIDIKDSIIGLMLYKDTLIEVEKGI